MSYATQLYHEQYNTAVPSAIQHSCPMSYTTQLFHELYNTAVPWAIQGSCSMRYTTQLFHELYNTAVPWAIKHSCSMSYTTQLYHELYNTAVPWAILLLLKKLGSARLGERGIHPISPKTPAPQYQPIDRKKRNGKRVEDYSIGTEQLRPIKKHWPFSWNPPAPHHRIRG